VVEKLDTQEVVIKNTLLSSMQTLDRILRNIEEKYLCKIFTLEKPVSLKTEECNQHCCGHHGYIYYRSFIVLELHGKTWALTVGQNQANFPGDYYDGDLIAIELHETDIKKIKKQFSKSVEDGGYFKNSLLISASDHRFVAADHSRFGLGILRYLPNYRDQKIEITQEEIRPGQQPIYGRRLLYKKDEIEALAALVVELLSNYYW